MNGYMLYSIGNCNIHNVKRIDMIEIEWHNFLIDSYYDTIIIVKAIEQNVKMW